jgi:hypothetical protein
MLAGVWLRRGQVRGLQLSLILQALQILQVVVPGLAFVLVLGPSVVFGFPSGQDFSFSAALEPEAAVALWHHDSPFRLQFNVLALVLFIALRRSQLQREQPKAALAPTGV